MRNFLYCASPSVTPAGWPPSLKYQPDRSMAAAVGLKSSTASTNGGSVCVSTSLTTIELIGARPADPGEPPYSVLLRQLSGLLGSPAASMITNVAPSPSGRPG